MEVLVNFVNFVKRYFSLIRFLIQGLITKTQLLIPRHYQRYLEYCKKCIKSRLSLDICIKTQGSKKAFSSQIIIICLSKQKDSPNLKKTKVTVIVARPVCLTAPGRVFR